MRTRIRPGLEDVLLHSIPVMLGLVMLLGVWQWSTNEGSLGYEVDVIEAQGGRGAVYKATPDAINIEPSRIVLKRGDGSKLYLSGTFRIKSYPPGQMAQWKALDEHGAD